MSDEQKLKPGHFWAMVSDQPITESNEGQKRIVVDKLSIGCMAVHSGDTKGYLAGKRYTICPWCYYKEIKDPVYRPMTAEEAVWFMIKNPCMVRLKTWQEGYCSTIGTFNQRTLTFNQRTLTPKEWQYKLNPDEDWQEFIIEVTEEEE